MKLVKVDADVTVVDRYCRYFKALRLKQNTLEKLMIFSTGSWNATYLFHRALAIFPWASVRESDAFQSTLESSALSAMFDEGDENLIACLGVCYVFFNGAYRPRFRIISVISGTRVNISSTCRSWIFMDRETCEEILSSCLLSCCCSQSR